MLRGLACCVLSLALGFAATGQEAPSLDKIAIGYFGPDDPGHALGGDAWLAARMAIDEANEAGGHEGLPFELVPVWSEDPWGTGVARLSQAVYRDGLWAIVAAMDGASVHLAGTVVAKAHLPLLAAASTDKTVNMARVPWIFSCMPTDDTHAAVLSRAVLEGCGERPFTLVSTTDHDSQLVSTEWIQSLSRLGRSPLHHLQVESGLPNLAETVERLMETTAEAVVILASPEDSARLVVALRGHGLESPVYGGPSMGRRTFLERAGSAANGVLFPSACDPAAADGSFGRAFHSIHGRRPDCATLQVYDAMRLLVAAVHDAGLDRAEIRNSLRDLSPWIGAAGAIEWDSLGRNLRTVHLATIRDGRVAAAD